MDCTAEVEEVIEYSVSYRCKKGYRNNESAQLRPHCIRKEVSVLSLFFLLALSLFYFRTLKTYSCPRIVLVILFLYFLNVLFSDFPKKRKYQMAQNPIGA